MQPLQWVAVGVAAIGLGLFVFAHGALQVLGVMLIVVGAAGRVWVGRLGG